MITKVNARIRSVIIVTFPRKSKFRLEIQNFEICRNSSYIQRLVHKKDQCPEVKTILCIAQDNRQKKALYEPKILQFEL